MNYFYNCQGQYKNNNIIESFNNVITEYADDDETNFYNSLDSIDTSAKFIKLGLTETDVLDSTLITTLTQNDIPNNIASNLVDKYIPPKIDSNGNVTQSDFLDDDTPTKYYNEITSDNDFRFLNCGQQSICLGHMMKYVCTALIINLKSKVINAFDELKQDITTRLSTPITILSNLESYRSFSTDNDKANSFIDKAILGSLNEFFNASKSIYSSLVSSSDATVMSNRNILKNAFKNALSTLKDAILSPNDLLEKIHSYTLSKNSYESLTNNVSILNIDVNYNSTTINKNIYKCQFIDNQDFSNLTLLDGSVYSVTASTSSTADSVVI